MLTQISVLTRYALLIKTNLLPLIYIDTRSLFIIFKELFKITFTLKIIRYSYVFYYLIVPTKRTSKNRLF